MRPTTKAVCPTMTHVSETTASRVSTHPTDLVERADDGLRAGQRVAAELEEALTRHLLAGRTVSDVGHVILAALTAEVVFWRTVPRWMSLTWLVAVIVTAALRAYHRRRVIPALTDPLAIRALLRRDVWLAALLWGGWALLLTGAPPKELAFLAIIIAGLVAAATSTLVADGPAFLGFTGLLILPLAVAVAGGGFERDDLALLLLLALFTPFMVTVFKRAHGVLIEEIRARARLRISEEETARRRDVLNALVTSAPMAIVVLDASGMITRTNPAFDRLLGARIGGDGWRSILDIVDTAEDRAGLEDFLARLREGERGVREISIESREGKAIWMRLTGTAASGMAPGTVILMGEDVTEQVEAQHAQERARIQAEEAARAKSSFLASMSHEIRTPMNGILGMIEILMDTPLTDEQRSTAEIIRSSGDGLLRILNDVLDVSKIEAGQLDLDEVDFDLHALVGEVGRVFASAAAAKGNELLVDIQEGTPRLVHGDSHRIRQIFTNLVGNAVKFTTEGEVVIGVRAEGTDEAGHHIRFSVRDTGIGIPAEKHDEIFEEFEQADKSTTRTYGGTGLGLTISRRLVELMGGKLRVDSAPGQGSDFFFTLVLPPSTEARVADGGRVGPSVSLRDERFLVVDDNDTARRIVRETLKCAGAAEVVEAGGVDAGLAALREAHRDGRAFAAVILDHMMPGKDGFDFVREARADDTLPLPPLLMVTSAGLPGGARAAGEAGISGFLSKPVSRTELGRALETLLGAGSSGGIERRLLTRDTTGRSGGMRILLAEDNMVNQQVASALLRKRGHTVTAVGDGKRAVEAVEAGAFDLVLMDIQMPEMDGIEATRQIRTGKSAAELPIVALTAHAFAEERARCREAGMNDFLAKPFKPDDLYEIVDRWVATGAPAVVETRTEDDMERGAGGDPPVDVAAFRRMMHEAGVEEVVDATLDIYMSDTPTLFSELATAVEADDHEGVRAKAHSLKSASGNIRADAFARLLEGMEDLGRRGDSEGIRDAFPGLRAEYHVVMEYLREQRAG